MLDSFAAYLAGAVRDEQRRKFAHRPAV